MAKVKKKELREQREFIEKYLEDYENLEKDTTLYNHHLLELVTDLFNHNMLPNYFGPKEQIKTFDYEVIEGLTSDVLNYFSNNGMDDKIKYYNELKRLYNVLRSDTSDVNINRSGRKISKSLIKRLDHRIQNGSFDNELVSLLEKWILQNKDKALFEKLNTDMPSIFLRENELDENFVTKTVHRYAEAVKEYVSSSDPFAETSDMAFCDTLLEEMRGSIQSLNTKSKMDIKNYIEIERMNAINSGNENFIKGINILKERFIQNNYKMPKEDHDFVCNLELGDNAYALIQGKDIILDKKNFTEHRGLDIITIDNNSDVTKDDALSCQKLEDGYMIGVHIIDPISYFMEDEKASSIIDGEGNGAKLIQSALYKAETIYTVDNKEVPLFPDYVIDLIKPLKEGEESKVNSFYFNIDNNGEVRGFSIKKETIVVRKNYSLEEVDKILDNNLEGNNTVKLLEEATEALKKDNVYAQKYFASKKGGKEASKGETIISNMMLLANSRVARHFAARNLPYIYRNFENNFNDIANKKYHFIKGLSEGVKEEALETLEKDSMPKYSSVNKGHNGVNEKAYGHITSPLRRSADLFNIILLNQFYYSPYSEYDYNYLKAFTTGYADFINNKKIVNERAKAKRKYYQDNSDIDKEAK